MREAGNAARHLAGAKSTRPTRTRSALIRAGQDLFANRPADSVTIDELVECANVAKGSFYTYFDDKTSLIAEICRVVQDDIENTINLGNRDIGDAAVRIVRALCVVLKYDRDHPDRLQAYLSLSKRGSGTASPLNVGLAADIRRGLEERRFSWIDPEVGILIILGLFSAAVTHARATAPPLDNLATSIGSAMLRALGVEGTEAMMLSCQAFLDIFKAD